MLWRPDAAHPDSLESLDPCLWRRSSLAVRAHAWYVGLLPQDLNVTLEVSDRGVLAYADGRVAGHALLGLDGALTVTVLPEFEGRGIEDQLVAQATRIGHVAGSWERRPPT